MALTAGALALPGLVGSALADAPVDRVSASYGYSKYLEDSLPASKVVAGSLDRMEIDSHQFRVEGPIFDRMDISADVMYESMSGASPIFSIPDANGDPVQVMSQATIEESRTDALLTGNYYFDDATASLAAGVSIENDYRAFNISMSGQRTTPDKNMTVSAGAGVSFDTIEPTDADLTIDGTEVYPLRPTKEEKTVFNAFMGMSHIITRSSVVQSSINFRHGNGYLSDPYKQVSLGGGQVGADSRPSVRNQMAWLTRYRHHFDRVSGTLHADYRFSTDDWGISAHTFDLAWYQTFWERFRLTPSIRYYSQGQADFYAPFFNGLPQNGFATSDYRMAAFGALAVRVKAEALLEGFGIYWRAALSWERYVSSADLALQKVALENPGLVSFNLLSARLTARF